jgi:hypothetical protein
MDDVNKQKQATTTKNNFTNTARSSRPPTPENWRKSWIWI